jgi:molecular chaperone DnaK
LGIETLGEVFTKIIERNTTIPTSKTQTFSTATDGQTSVEIHVLQGERAMAKDNKSLGKFQLTGIPPSPRGVPQIEVSFEIDANGILQVSARDKGTGREQSIRITNTGGLSEAEVERMREEAEVYADEDRRRKQLVELRNQAEALIHSYEITLREHTDSINEELKDLATNQMRELQREIGDRSATPEQVKQHINALQQTLIDIGTDIYRQVSSDRAYVYPSSDPSAPWPNGHVEPSEEDKEDYSIENDETITADYEAVD